MRQGPWSRKRREPDHRRTWLAPFLALSAFIALLPAGTANHTQSDTGNAIAFDHVTGNEWWVEVALSGAGAASVVRVEAMDTNGPWVTLAKKSWGPYAASFHIEPGNQVRFRASWNSGAQQVSCWFTHPAGVEQCTSPPPFEATFTGVRGNEWWVQAQVATNGEPISRVDVRLNGGAWMALAKQSWGGWAASYRITQGTIVQLMATSTSGATDLSSCRQWIPPPNTDAAIVACTSGAFDATFTGVKGNDWWVQANVAGNKQVTAVYFRVNCVLHWTPLVKQSWGGWAGSFHIPPGSKVDFQAETSTFESDASGGYIWPQATPTSGCPQGNWPRHGSYVTYEISSGVCGGGNCESTSATFHSTYHAGFPLNSGHWIGGCEGEDRATFTDGSETVTPWTSDNTGLPPPWLPPNTQVGAQHRPDMIHARFGSHGCSMGWISSPVTVMRQEDYTLLRDDTGDTTTLRAWYAESSNPEDNRYTAHWDTKIGLVLDISSHPRMSGQGSEFMFLRDTNAPLA